MTSSDPVRRTEGGRVVHLRPQAVGAPEAASTGHAVSAPDESIISPRGGDATSSRVRRTPTPPEGDVPSPQPIEAQPAPVATEETAKTDTGRKARTSLHALLKTELAARLVDVRRDQSGKVSCVRPPFLASEVLKEDLAPREPGRTTLRAGGAALGLVGVSGVLAFGGNEWTVFAVAATLAAICISSISPMEYRVRALLVAAFAAIGLGIATFVCASRGGVVEAPVLTTGVLVLASGLFFRAYHRASRGARWIVAVGCALLGTWLLLSGGLHELAVIDANWQSWLVVALRVVLGLVLLLSLLAFMNANTTGGARASSTVLLAWYGAYVVTQLGVRIWPSNEGHVGASVPYAELFGTTGLMGDALPATLVAMTIASTVFVALGALAFAQCFVVFALRKKVHAKHKDEHRT